MSVLMTRGTCKDKLKTMRPKRNNSLGLVNGTFCGWTKDDVHTYNNRK